MEYFEIEGGHKLKGEILPQGAKNEALEILCATLLTAETVTISRVPDILDVVRLTELLALLGSEVTRVSKDTWTFNGKNIDPERILDPAFRTLAQKLRGSFMILGPLIARFGKAWMPLPGGDKIGRRRVDTHLYGLKMLGAKFDYDAQEGFFKAWSDGRLKGTTMLLDEPSVTGTADRKSVV